MLPVVALYHPFVEIGIAIGAPKVASVVDAHICRLDTLTTFTLVLVLAWCDINTEEIVYQVAVNAGAMVDADGSKVYILTAGKYLQFMAVGDLLEAFCHLVKVIL